MRILSVVVENAKKNLNWRTIGFVVIIFIIGGISIEEARALCPLLVTHMGFAMLFMKEINVILSEKISLC